jgi:hypothetical protein
MGYPALGNFWASGGAYFNPIQQKIGKQKRSKMICSNLHLKSVLGFCKRAHHDAGIVNKYVNPFLFGVDFLGTFSDGLQT